MNHWTEFGLRNSNRPPLSARERVTDVPAGLASRVAPRQKLLADPLEGVRAGDGLQSLTGGEKVRLSDDYKHVSDVQQHR